VPNASAQEFYDFMINPTTERYQAWWPGEHLDFRIVKHGRSDHVGDIVYMDEYIGEGNRRLKFHAQVKSVKRHRQIVWQMRKFGLLLPAYVVLGLKDTPKGLIVTHELRLGYKGLGKLLDPLIKLYFNDDYRYDLEGHCKIEWHLLAAYLEELREGWSL